MVWGLGFRDLRVGFGVWGWLPGKSAPCPGPGFRNKGQGFRVGYLVNVVAVLVRRLGNHCVVDNASVVIGDEGEGALN